MTDDYSLAEVVRALEKLESSMDSGFAEVKNNIQRLEDNYVTRTEFDLYKESNDREIKTLRDSTEKPKVSGWTIGFGVIGSLVGLSSIGALIITLIQVVK